MPATNRAHYASPAANTTLLHALTQARGRYALPGAIRYLFRPFCTHRHRRWRGHRAPQAAHANFITWITTVPLAEPRQAISLPDAEQIAIARAEFAWEHAQKMATEIRRATTILLKEDPGAMTIAEIQRLRHRYRIMNVFLGDFQWATQQRRQLEKLAVKRPELFDLTNWDNTVQYNQWGEAEGRPQPGQTTPRPLHPRILF